MNTCPNCHADLKPEACFCPVCGTAVHPIIPNSHPVPQIMPKPEHTIHTEPSSYDHTDTFDPEDIHATRLVCMVVYLLDFVGIIIGLLAARDSEYTTFHIQQSMRFTVLEVLLSLAAGVFCWTVLVPIAAAVAMAALTVVKFICFIQVCNNKAIEAPLIRNIGFLK
jgi:uncharacterized membrane protein